MNQYPYHYPPHALHSAYYQQIDPLTEALAVSFTNADPASPATLRNLFDHTCTGSGPDLQRARYRGAIQANSGVDIRNAYKIGTASTTRVEYCFGGPEVCVSPQAWVHDCVLDRCNILGPADIASSVLDGRGNNRAIVSGSSLKECIILGPHLALECPQLERVALVGEGAVALEHCAIEAGRSGLVFCPPAAECWDVRELELNPDKVEKFAQEWGRVVRDSDALYSLAHYGRGLVAVQELSHSPARPSLDPEVRNASAAPEQSAALATPERPPLD